MITSSHNAMQRLEAVKHLYNPVLVSSEPEAGKILSVAEGGCLLPPHPSVLERIKKENFNDVLNPYQTYSKHFLEELMYEIVDYFKDTLRIDLNEDGSSKNWIVIGNGSAHLFDALLSTAFDRKNGFAGQNQKAVLAPTPYYHSYAAYPENHDAYYEPIFVEGEKDYKLNAAALDRKMMELKNRGESAKILVLTNPTISGAIYSYEEMKELSEAVVKHDLVVFNDEVFKDSEFNIQQKTVSMAEIPGMDEHVITATSGSKTRSTAGLRVGWAVGPRKLINKMTHKINTSIIQLPLITQYAATEALKTPQSFLNVANHELVQRAEYLKEKIANINMDLQASGIEEQIQLPVNPRAGHYLCLNFDQFKKNKNFVDNGLDLVNSVLDYTSANCAHAVLYSSGYSRGEDALTLYLAFSQTGHSVVNKYCYGHDAYRNPSRDAYQDPDFLSGLSTVLNDNRRILDMPLEGLGDWLKSYKR